MFVEWIKKLIFSLRQEWGDIYASRPVLLTVGGGAFVGLVIFLVYISNFFSYLSDRPETCVNCHIMGPQYAAWQHSSHREAATCNDCHVPQDHVWKKYFFKGMDGLRHSTIFTLRTEPQAIIMKSAGIGVVENNCKRCHQALFTQPTGKNDNFYSVHGAQGKLCWSCHRETPHGLVRSLSSAPFGQVPTTESMIPAWMQKRPIKEKQPINKL